MELRHLRYFVAVANEGHMTRAAERLGIKQPPLSQQIQALEQELDVRLFHRKPRGMELTEAGEVFFNEARKTLAHAERAVASARKTARGEAGMLMVGLTVSASLYPLISTVIRTFRQRYPGVSLVLDEHGTTELLNLLRTESLDVAFIRSRMPDSDGIAVELVTKEPLILAVPSAHPLAKSKSGPVEMNALKDEPLILSHRRAGGRPLFDAVFDAVVGACRNAGFEPRLVQETPQILTSLNMVAAALGSTIVPASLHRVKMQGVRYLDIAPGPGTFAPVYLAFRKSQLTAAATNFIHLVRRAAKESPHVNSTTTE